MAVLTATRRWGPKIGLSMADQGVLSGANFLMNILLARWLPAAEYGAFSVGYAIFLFLSGFHNSFVLEPMGVLGPAHQGDDYPVYLRALIWINAACTIALALLLTLGGFLSGDRVLQQTLWGLAISGPLVLTFWVFRRVNYLHANPSRAAITSSIYAGVLLSGLVALQRFGQLDVLSALLTMGLAGLAASSWGWVRLGLPLGSLFRLPGSVARHMLVEHLRYGRWVAAQSTLGAGFIYAQGFLSAGFLGFAASGGLRATQVFTLPMAQAITAVSTLALPMLSTEFIRNGHAGLQRRGRVILLLLVGTAAIYEVALVALAAPLEEYVYGGKYGELRWLLPVLGLVPVFTALAESFSLRLRAMRRPEHYLIVALVSTPVSVGSALLLIWQMGLVGAAISMVLTVVAGASVDYYLYRRWSREALERPRPPEERQAVSAAGEVGA